MTLITIHPHKQILNFNLYQMYPCGMIHSCYITGHRHFSGGPLGAFVARCKLTRRWRSKKLLSTHEPYTASEHHNHVNCAPRRVAVTVTWHCDVNMGCNYSATIVHMMLVVLVLWPIETMISFGCFPAGDATLGLLPLAYQSFVFSWWVSLFGNQVIIICVTWWQEITCKENFI